jgi:hypothetical protein
VNCTASKGFFWRAIATRLEACRTAARSSLPRRRDAH